MRTEGMNEIGKEKEMKPKKNEVDRQRKRLKGNVTGSKRSN